MHYFAYGSNMDTERLASRVGPVGPGVKGVLSGFTLRFNKRPKNNEGGRANLVPQQNAETEGVLFELSDEQCSILDTFEGEGYKRHTMPIRVGAALKEGVVYLATPSFVGEDRPPPEQYAAYILRGAQSHGLSEAYIKKLSALINASQ